MRTAVLFILAGLLEIGGGYLVWLWLRHGHHVTLGIAGFVALASYGVIPALQGKDNPFGRLYAAYGAVFIVMSLLWGWSVDGRQPDTRDWLGAGLCVTGVLVMLWPRAVVT